MDETRLQALQRALGHRFTDPQLVLRACTHASFIDPQASDEQRLSEANERLEFVGDTLLGAAMGLLLFERFPQAAEGELSRRKARLVSRATLARAIEVTDLLDHCRVGGQMQQPWPDSVKANLAEGILAAVYLDGGWEALCAAVDRLLASFVDAQGDDSPGADTKNRLQSWALEHHGRLPEYATERTGGSDHAPTFRCRVTVGQVQAEGEGSSRRRAETAAAARLLAQVGG